jgi:RNA polymerase sigma factor (sigma-70 family)
MTDVLVRLRAAAHRAQDRNATDAELLSAFVDGQSGPAFEAILRRHGPTVLAVCRRILRTGPDAEDAFQATFLVLARKAAVVRPRSALAGWLYGVAVRSALKVRSAEARRRAREKEVATMPRPADDAAPCPDTLAALNRELGRLPNELRATVVLCDLEGKTRAAAARQLGWPEGTVASRLARARHVLARRLKAAAPVLTIPLVPAAVPNRLLAHTLTAATRYAAGGKATASAVAVSAAEEVMTDMLITKLTKVTAMLVAVVTATALGLGVATAPTAAAPAPAAKGRPAADDLAAQLKTARSLNGDLLAHDDVLTDLKCTPDQRREIADLIKAAQDEYVQSVKAAFEKMAAQMVGPGGGAATAKVTYQNKINYDQARLTSILKPEQVLRIRQLEIQLRGPLAFIDRRVVRALGLTAQQEEKIEEIVIKHEPDYHVQSSKLVGGGKDVHVEELAELLERNTAECLKLLTPDQRATWDWLVGKKMKSGAWVRAVSPNVPEMAGAIKIGGFGGAVGGAKIALPGGAPPPGVIAVPPAGGVILPAKPVGKE